MSRSSGPLARTSREKMTRPATRAVVLHSAELRRASGGHRVRVRVKLERPSKGFYYGTAERRETVVNDLKCAAEATIKALGLAVSADRKVEMELKDVQTFEAFGQPAVMVSVNVTIDDDTKTLMGFSPTRDGPTAAARAVLDATNRLLGIG